MKLDTSLVDVAGNFGALRFVFFELPLQIGNLVGILVSDFDGLTWDDCGLAAFLTVHGQTGCGAIDHKRRRAVSARKKDVAARVLG